MASTATAATGKNSSPVGNAHVLLFILLLSTFSGSFSQSMMNVALPEVAHRFDITLSMANWIIVGYTVVAATCITTVASLMRRIGMRKVFTIACSALALGSLLCTFALNFPMLVIGRLIQAISNGFLYPMVTSTIAIIVDQSKRGTVLAVNSAIIGFGLALSPLVSGFILTTCGFTWMFIPPLVLAVILLIMGNKFVVNLHEREKTPIDGLSLILSFLGLAALMYGLGEITHDLLPSLIALAIGATIIALFVWRQLKLKTPLLNLTPLAHPKFTVGIILVMLGFMAQSSMSLLLPLYLEGTAGFSAALAGAFLVVPILFYVGFTVIGGKVFDKHGIWPLVPLGFMLAFVGLVGVLIAADHLLVILSIAIACLVFGGVGFISAPSKTIALNQLSQEVYSYGAAINSVFVQIASSIGSALFVGVLSADVLRLTASGTSHADAYAFGFAHTLWISIVLAAFGIALSIIYSRRMRTRVSSHEKDTASAAEPSNIAKR